MVILDTNILIEIYKGNPIVEKEIEHIGTTDFYISAITFAEFMVGARNKADLRRIEKHLTKYIVIPIDQDVTDVFINLFKRYALSHRPDIADALIAATALHYGIPLLTYNKRHFQFIPGIVLV